MIRALILSLLIATSAHAQTAGEAAAADVATTGIGLALGAAEANPIGLLTMPAKLIALDYANSLPTGDREYALSLFGSLWTGAAANNLCVIAAIVTGGAFAPACIGIGIAVASAKWQAEANERLFWAICASEKKINPRLTCEFTKPMEGANAAARRQSSAPDAG